MNLSSIWLKAFFFSLGLHLLTAFFLFYLPRPSKPSFQVVHLKLKSVTLPAPAPGGLTRPKKVTPQKSKAPKSVPQKTRSAPPKRLSRKSKTALSKKKKVTSSRKKSLTPKTTKKAPKKASSPPKPRVSPEEERLLAQRLAALKEEKKLKERLARLQSRPKGQGPGGISLGGGISEEFARRLMVHLRSFWAVPEILQGHKDLSAEVQLQLAPDGRLISFRFLRPSGEPLFDEAVVATLKRAQPLPAPGKRLTISAVFKIY